MKVTEFESFVVQFDQEDNYHTMLVLRVHTDEGVTGTAYHSSKGWDRTKMHLDVLEGGVRGQDPRFIKSIISRLRNHNYLTNLDVQAIAMIDMALWDILGKWVGQPVYRLLGAAHEKVPCYASLLGSTRWDVDVMHDQATKIKKLGVRGIKMWVGALSVKTDVERIRAVKEVMGEDFPVMLDCSQMLTVAEAEARGLAYQDAGGYWLEEPIPCNDVDGLARLSAALTMPVASGEHDSFKDAFRELLKRESIDIVQLDPHYAGGITECIEIAAMAAAYNIPVTTHTPASWPLGVNILCAAPNALICEWSPGKVDDLKWFGEAYRMEDGYLYPREVPGLGIDFAPDLEQYKLSWEQVLKLPFIGGLGPRATKPRL